MQRLIIILVILSIQDFTFGQNIERAYPKTLKVPDEIFYLRFSNDPNLIRMKIDEADTVDMGTDGAPGLYVTIYFGKDSLIIPYTNGPYEEVFFIPIQSPKRKIVYLLHFNRNTSQFPISYMNKNKGNVQIEIPEVYELANIIWTLSPSGQRATDLNKEGTYYRKVFSYFKSYLDHPIFTKLDFSDSIYFKNYYDFRENSIAFNFKENKLLYSGPYYYVTGDDWKNFNSLFRRLLPLIEDFAQKSKFRDFYKSNKIFYSQLIEREKELMPIRKMWSWLEQQFPPIKYQSYKVIFSPLIGGSHSTQNFSAFNKTEWFRETVMFVCGTDRYDRRAELSEKQKEGLMSGIVFTEIDHNYVNGISSKYSKTIDSVFSNREIWTSAGRETDWYNNPQDVFNEYMTHSVFCLWVLENYEKTIADFVIENRESLMVERRHFGKFKEFNRALIELRGNNKGKKIIDLFPAVLKWCKTHK